MLSFLCEVIGRPLVVSLVANPDKPTASLPDGQHDEDFDHSDSGFHNIYSNMDGPQPNAEDVVVVVIVVVDVVVVVVVDVDVVVEEAPEVLADDDFKKSTKHIRMDEVQFLKPI